MNTLINPTTEQKERNSNQLSVAGTTSYISMVSSKEGERRRYAWALLFGHRRSQKKLVAFQEEIVPWGW